MVAAVYMVEAGPNTYKSAMESDEACEWQEAINPEYASLEKNKMFTFVHEILETKNAIPTQAPFKSWGTINGMARLYTGDWSEREVLEPPFPLRRHE